MGGKLKSSTAISKLCCITNLIRFMNEAEKLMKGSVHKGDFLIFHDALVLMAAKEKINWMRKNGYLHQYVFPSMDCRMGLLTPDILLVIAPNHAFR